MNLAAVNLDSSFLDELSKALEERWINHFHYSEDECLGVRVLGIGMSFQELDLPTNRLQAHLERIRQAPVPGKIQMVELHHVQGNVRPIREAKGV